jgi:hypothetical protein
MAGTGSMTRFLVFLSAGLLGAGCGSHRPAADIERGRQAVVAALDSWKTNDPPAKLKTLPDPVEFSEELRATHTLTDYTLGRVDSSEKDVIRYAVALKLKDKKGKLSEREVVYAVALKTPVVVARDPYY